MNGTLIATTIGIIVVCFFIVLSILYDRGDSWVSEHKRKLFSFSVILILILFGMTIPMIKRQGEIEITADQKLVKLWAAEAAFSRELALLDEIGLLQTYYGFFPDVDGDQQSSDKQQPAIVMEEYKLQFSKRSGRVYGLLTDGDHQAWDVQGFSRKNDLALIFGSVPTNKMEGVGATYLGKSGSDYTGKALLKDCEKRQVYECPYALTLENIDKNAARLRWSELFAKKCEPIDIGQTAMIC